MRAPKYATLFEKYPHTTVLYSRDVNRDVAIIKFLYLERLDPRDGSWGSSGSTMVDLLRHKASLPPGLYKAARATLRNCSHHQEEYYCESQDFLVEAYNEEGPLDEELRKAMILPRYAKHAMKIMLDYYLHNHKCPRIINVPIHVLASFLDDGLRWTSQHPQNTELAIYVENVGIVWFAHCRDTRDTRSETVRDTSSEIETERDTRSETVRGSSLSHYASDEEEDDGQSTVLGEDTVTDSATEEMEDIMWID
jgi:hypothetical protein